MGSYIFPIKTALLTFPVVAFFITFPFLLYQYRKHGYVNKFRAFILYTFVLYLMCAFYLIILPLPETRQNASLQPPNAKHYSLVPFNFVQDIIKETDVVWSKPSTYINLLKERAFLQAAFNGILLLPLGIYLAYYFKKSFKQVVLICFLTSLFFEVTQLTGIYWIYECPYRLFDVDDLILNTFGGVLGYLISPMFRCFLPKVEKLDENIDFETAQVGYIRRWLAFSIDWVIIEVCKSIIKGFINFQDNIISSAIIIFIYFMVIPYLTNGKTLGKAIVKIRIKGRAERISFIELFQRYGLLYYLIGGVNYTLKAVNSLGDIYGGAIAAGIIYIIGFVINLIFFVHVFLHLFKKDKDLFYEKLSRTTLRIDSFKNEVEDDSMSL